MKIYHDQVIEAAFLHTKPGCYFIGPFARRVSFASQQRRALHLVEALGTKGLLGRRDGRPLTCAVIGGGVAGLTACAALRSWDCNVHVYERKPEPLFTQSKASHRLIHPTIARWPGEPLKLTTEFDFLDWATGPCSDVIACLREDWRRILGSAAGHGIRLIDGVRVDELETGNGKVWLILDDTDRAQPLPKEAQPPEGYDLVIVATGFGEQDAAGLSANSYWSEMDPVKAWCVDAQKQVLVSGAGDGGLIDALRLVHTQFDDGWLAVRLAHRIGDTFRDEIIRAEDQALMEERSIAFMMFGDRGKEPTTMRVGSAAGSHESIRKLAQLYMRIAAALPSEAQALLDESTRGVRVGRVKLVSPQPAPFSTYAAPIHKIMIAHAMTRGVVNYAVGRVSMEGERAMLHAFDDMESTPVRRDLVVRHSSPANLETLLGPIERNTLRLRQMMLADYIDTDMERSDRLPDGYPAFTDASRAEFIASRYQMAANLLHGIAPDLSLTATLDGFVYERRDVEERGREPGDIPIPPSFFRIPLSEDDVARAPAL